MSGRQMSQTTKYQGAKCLGREMSLPPIVWGTYCPGSQMYDNHAYLPNDTLQIYPGDTFLYQELEVGSSKSL